MIFAKHYCRKSVRSRTLALYYICGTTQGHRYFLQRRVLKIPSKFGCPDKFFSMVSEFHDGMQASDQDDGQFLKLFLVTNGVQQGCVLAPTLFSIILSAMLSNAYRNHDNVVGIRYRFDGNLFNLKRLKARTKVQEDSIRDLLFADDSALNAGVQSEMQEKMDLFSDACDDFGFTISTKKTELMY